MHCDLFNQGLPNSMEMIRDVILYVSLERHHEIFLTEVSFHENPLLFKGIVLIFMARIHYLTKKITP